MLEFKRKFRAMNTDVVAVVAPERKRRREAERALDGVEELFKRNEMVMSRFLPDSELSRLNGADGRPFAASPLLFAVVSEAVAAARNTKGIFDPTVLGALMEAGYDRSFELINPGNEDHDVKVRANCGSPGLWRQVVMDPGRRTITMPKGCGLDLGGIGKGWTVDQAVQLLRPFHHFAVDAGGDLYAGGAQANGLPWSVGVENPFHVDQDLLALELRDRAVATSSISHRRWRRGDKRQNHLIDPRTGRPAESDVAAATVIAGSVSQAELIAKVALLLGYRGGQQLLRDIPNVEGLLVLNSGQVISTKGFLEAGNAA